MMFCSAMIIMLAIAAFQVARASAGGVYMPYLWDGGFVYGLILVARAVVSWRWKQGMPRDGWTALACGVVVPVVVGTRSPLALEEYFAVGLLSVGAARFAFGAGARPMSHAAIIASVVVLMMLPSMHERHRLAFIAAATMTGAAWLLMTQFDALRSRSWTDWIAGLSACGLVVAGVLLAHRWIAPSDGNPSYAAFVPSSGGDGEGDEQARRGTGDGPDEIAGDSPDSVGFDQSNNFSESAKDGLYDLWIESFGEPLKSDPTQKMIGLKPTDVQFTQASDRENLKVGRKFEVHRRASEPKQASDKPDSGTDAAVWVSGPMPVYVPLAAFDAFDGDAWSEIEQTRSAVPVRLVEDRWMEILLRPLSPAFAGENAYQIRIGSLGGKVLPLPMLVERFRMGRVNRPDFFDSSRWGGVRLARRNVPAGATLDVISRRIAPGRLVGVEIALVSHSNPVLLDDSQLTPAARDLARQWAGEDTRGWRQVQRVLERLREHAVHDPLSSLPLGADPVETLLESRRGSSHQFATAGVLMLRSLGYPTRLASGFFADETDVDSRSGYAAMNARHTHFWPEVRLADGTWIAVDATPGYPLLNLPVPIGERVADVWSWSQRLLSEHTLAVIACVVGLVLLWIGRSLIVDTAVTVVCRLYRYDTPWVLRVLETRARLAGVPRPAHEPWGRWLRRVSAEPGVWAFADVLNGSIYGRSALPRAEAAAALRLLGLARIKRARPGGKP